MVRFHTLTLQTHAGGDLQADVPRWGVIVVSRPLSRMKPGSTPALSYWLQVPGRKVSSDVYICCTLDGSLAKLVRRAAYQKMEERQILYGAWYGAAALHFADAGQFAAWVSRTH